MTEKDNFVSFTPNDSLAMKAVCFELINAVAFVLWTGVEQMKRLSELPQAARATNGDLIAMQLLDVGVTLGYLVVWLLCFIAVTRWMYRAYLNSLVLDNGGTAALVVHPKLLALDIVMSWVIPIYNLFRPLQYLRRMWKSCSLHDSSRLPTELGVYWAIWVALNLVSAAQFVASIQCGSMLSPAIDIAFASLEITRVFFAIQIIRSITERQQHKIHALQAN